MEEGVSWGCVLFETLWKVEEVYIKRYIKDITGRFLKLWITLIYLPVQKWHRSQIQVTQETRFRNMCKSDFGFSLSRYHILSLCDPEEECFLKTLLTKMKMLFTSIHFSLFLTVFNPLQDIFHPLRNILICCLPMIQLGSI